MKEVFTMELIKTNYKELDHDGIHYETTEYDLGGYEVEYYTATKGSDRRERIHVSVKDRRSYLPEIYYEDDFYGKDKKWFDIQTTSYGAMTPDKIKEVVAGYEQALEAVAILTKEFIK